MVIKNKSATSAVALARERQGGLKAKSILYKIHEKTALSAGILNKKGKEKK